MRNHTERLKEDLVRNLRLHFFENGEADRVLADIDSLGGLGPPQEGRKLRRKALALSLALSNVSSNLVPRALGYIRTASACLPPKELEQWIAHAFDLLDSKGLEPAISFLSKTDEVCLVAFASPEGLKLDSVKTVLETYIRGISGSDIRISPDKEAFTDTLTLYLPPVLERFKENDGNFLLYKLMAAHNWALAAGGSLTFSLDAEKFPLPGKYKGQRADIEDLFNQLPDRRLGIEVYGLLEAIRLDGFLRAELPGLMKNADRIREKIFEARPRLDTLSGKAALIEALHQYYLSGRLKGKPKGGEAKTIREAVKRAESLKGASVGDSLRALVEIVEFSSGLGGAFEEKVLFLGSIRPEKVREGIRARKRALRKNLEAAITRLLAAPEFEPREKPPGEKRPKERFAKPELEYLAIKGRLIELDPEMRELIEERGGVPGGILVKGSDLGAATPCVSLQDLIEEEENAGISAEGGIKYDEWDFRRGDYRKGWCTLYEHEVHPVHEPFVELTLKRYGGYVNILRKKFELLKREPKTVKRQREGEDIDLDAAVEALADMRAGLPPGENLFIKLDRAERNIAVLFLLDMSGSTKGWINEAEKEALVLMCEALESLGDRYAIYGFSGMTRNRCDLYVIKRFAEGYTGEVKSRIAGIAPKDYTRMGPPIRHSAKILKAVEARTKLFITLSDGKPEDYDAYKGDYGIEDTRRALIEAKEQGIHPFCITIDREASSYLPHMYGEVNYTFIDDVRKLPNKITEIYRRLTT